MDESTPAVVNREDPGPVISVSSHSVENSPSATGDKTSHDSVGSGLSARRLKNKFKGMKSEAKALNDWATGSSLQELLLTNQIMGAGYTR
ncbi:conserved hypothetical protein [Histoplasma mississippiense (nom. inval.)]|uniref:conserved hypothetical protein n=1 Tax=Ajellomyces capsulatus (strain NAm1 / WU24) TaxID=2059318 RepID=UPI000157CF69|nr:conserved hypothetical protein [Histoplasma mississippiense (nom. inval.)]EDN10765.1 conserved hypothetical protein [Histoplasma mississippiense (nom. inval.)]